MTPWKQRECSAEREKRGAHRAFTRAPARGPGVCSKTASTATSPRSRPPGHRAADAARQADRLDGRPCSRSECASTASASSSPREPHPAARPLSWTVEWVTGSDETTATRPFSRCWRPSRPGRDREVDGHPLRGRGRPRGRPRGSTRASLMSPPYPTRMDVPGLRAGAGPPRPTSMDVRGKNTRTFPPSGERPARTGAGPGAPPLRPARPIRPRRPGSAPGGSNRRAGAPAARRPPSPRTPPAGRRRGCRRGAPPAPAR